MIQIRVAIFPALNACKLVRCINNRTVYNAEQYSAVRTDCRPSSRKCSTSNTKIIDTIDQSVLTGHTESGIETEFDWAYLCNPNNKDSIRRNIVVRKGVGDIDKLVCMYL